MNKEENKNYQGKENENDEADSSIILKTRRWSSWTNYRNEKRNRAEIEESSIRSTTDLLLSRLSFLVFPPLLYKARIRWRTASETDDIRKRFSWTSYGREKGKSMGLWLDPRTHFLSFPFSRSYPPRRTRETFWTACVYWLGTIKNTCL